MDEAALHRYSLPFFYEPDISAVIRTVPELQGAPGTTPYEPVVFGDHLRAMYSATYKKAQPGASTSTPEQQQTAAAV